MINHKTTKWILFILFSVSLFSVSCSKKKIPKSSLYLPPCVNSPVIPDSNRTPYSHPKFDLIANYKGLNKIIKIEGKSEFDSFMHYCANNWYHIYPGNVPPEIYSVDYSVQNIYILYLNYSAVDCAELRNHCIEINSGKSQIEVFVKLKAHLAGSGQSSFGGPTFLTIPKGLSDNQMIVTFKLSDKFDPITPERGDELIYTEEV